LPELILGTFQLVKKLLAREIPMIPRFNFGVVDVRDVALAQMRAMTLPQAAGTSRTLRLNNLSRL